MRNKKLRDIYSLLCGVVISLGCAAQSWSGDIADKPVKVAISGDYPPFCDRDANGFDMVLLQKMAADLHWPKIETEFFEWPNLATLLREGRVDMALCGITMRPDRAKDMAFTRPYLISGAVAVVPAKFAGKFNTLSAIDKPGVRILVNAGGHLERLTRQQFSRASIHTTTNNLDLRAQLDLGAADVVISDIYESANWSGVSVVGPFTQDRKAIALPLDRLSLREQINAWLAAREADGWLASQRAKLNAGAAITPVDACAEAMVSDIDMRFALMPLVGAVKHRDGLPIVDAAQEAAVLAHAQQVAASIDLSAHAVEKLFALLIEQAKRIQRTSSEIAPETTTLASLRTAVAAASDALLPEVTRCNAVLNGHHDAMDKAVRTRLSGWLNEAEIAALLTVLPPRMDFSKPKLD